MAGVRTLTATIIGIRRRTMTMTAMRIDREAAGRLLDSCDGISGRYEPAGLFYLKEGDKFIGIDNSTGNAWTEEFPDEASCLRWLAGEE